MNNKTLTTKLARRLQWTPEEVSEMLADFVSLVENKLSDNDIISLQGFGQFEVRKKAERISVNPQTKKRYLVPPKLVPVFKPGSTVKAKLKNLGQDEQ